MRIRQGASGEIRVEPIEQGGFFTTEINGHAFAGPSIRIETKGGNDTILVESLPLPFAPAGLAVDAGAGNDTISFALDVAFAATAVADGGNGTDILFDSLGLTPANTIGIEAVAAGLPSWTEQGPGLIVDSPALFPVEGTKFPLSAAINLLRSHPGIRT